MCVHFSESMKKSYVICVYLFRKSVSFSFSCPISYENKLTFMCVCIICSDFGPIGAFAVVF